MERSLLHVTEVADPILGFGQTVQQKKGVRNRDTSESRNYPTLAVSSTGRQQGVTRVHGLTFTPFTTDLVGLAGRAGVLALPILSLPSARCTVWLLAIFISPVGYVAQAIHGFLPTWSWVHQLAGRTVQSGRRMKKTPKIATACEGRKVRPGTSPTAAILRVL